MLENVNHYGYFAKDVAIELEITASTLRRWAIELESAGYLIDRNDKNQRIYYERDFKALREIKRLLANRVSFSDTIKAVVSMDLEGKDATWTPSVYKQEMRLSKEDLQEIVHEEVKKAVTEEREIMHQAFEKKIDDTIEMRDRKIMATMNTILEERHKEIAATLEKKTFIDWVKKIFKRATA